MAAETSACLRWYGRTRRVFNAVTNLLNALHSGFWMGVLSEETFQRFDSYPHHIISLVNDSRYSRVGLEPWEQHCLVQHFQGCKSLLLVAGDAGREIASFVNAGMEVDAVEFAPHLVEKTNRLLAQEDFVERVALAPRYIIPSTKTYDGIWVGRQFLSNIHGRQKRIAFLKQLREHAGDHTTLLVSFYVRNSDGFDWRVNQWLANMGRFITRNSQVKAELGDHLDVEVPLYHHHYREGDLRDELRQAGWQVNEFTTDWFGYALATPVQETTKEEVSQAMLQKV